MALRLGDLLVNSGALTDAQRDAALEYQRLTGRPFGEIAEKLFGVHPNVIEAAWTEQYASIAPTIDPRDADVDPEALKLIERRQAWQFRILPLRFDRDDVVVCSTVQHLVTALRFTGWKIPKACYFVLAGPDHLGEALTRHYPIAGMTPDMVRNGIRQAG